MPKPSTEDHEKMPNNAIVSTITTLAERVTHMSNPSESAVTGTSPELVDALARVWRQLQPHVDAYPGLETMGKFIESLCAGQTSGR